VAAAFNLDMIGLLRGKRVEVTGLRTGAGWCRLLAEQNAPAHFHFDFDWAMRPEADHYPLFEKGIPILMLHTGMHDEYHRPSDTPETLNAPGMSRVVRLVFGMMVELAERPGRMTFRKAAQYETAEQVQKRLHESDPPPRLGVTLDPQSSPGAGVRLLGVERDSPAAKAGLKPGDRILRFAGKKPANCEELVGAVMAADSPAEAEVQSAGAEKPRTVSIALPGKPLRLGITWTVDDAEPGAVILTRVIPGSPAARAGLQPGDRIYQVGGRNFAGENEFLRLIKTPPEPLELLVERDESLQVVLLRLHPATPVKRAA
jgi:membrane-associated protease RseP (regulator of RpoE activity)